MRRDGHPQSDPLQPFSMVEARTSVTGEAGGTAASDRALAERVRLDGDEAAFRSLYRRHTPRLFQFALRLLAGNEHDAEDVVQETWLRAVERLGEFRWESSLGTWLGGIALNCCRGLYRRRDRHWLELRDDDSVVAPPRETLDAIALERALETLAPGYRTVLVLHDVEGFTHEEIGQRLEISANTSKSQLSRARRALRVQLARGEGRQARAET